MVSYEEDFEELAKEEKPALTKWLREWKIVRNKLSLLMKVSEL